MAGKSCYRYGTPRNIIVKFLILWVVISSANPDADISICQNLSAQTMPDSAVANSLHLQQLRLPNRFVRTDKTIHMFGQDLMAWHLYQNPLKLSMGMEPDNYSATENTRRALPVMDWSRPSPGTSQMGLDYRESSIYRPVNVLEYNEYKMGRSRYLPLASVAAGIYLAKVLYSKYGHILQKKEQERYYGLILSETEINAVAILWEAGRLNATDWYVKFNQKYLRQISGFSIFTNIIQELENKYLIKPRKLGLEEIVFLPALSAKTLVRKLREEKQFLDVIKDRERIVQIDQSLELLNQAD